MDPLTLTLVVSGLKLAIWGYSSLFGDTAVLKRMRATLAKRQAALQAAKAAQAARNAQIDAEPDKAGQDLADELKKDFGGKP